jgi:uncharacterized membrane protein
MKRKNLVFLIVSLMILELILTGFLAYTNLTSSASGFCVAGKGVSECNTVQNSIYGELFGVKLGILGFFAFLILLGVFIYEEKSKQNGLFFVLASVGALFAVYFIYIQLVVLKQICSTCVVVDGIAIVIFLAGFADRRKLRC